jgi:hypothetical protein
MLLTLSWAGIEERDPHSRTTTGICQRSSARQSSNRSDPPTASSFTHLEPVMVVPAEVYPPQRIRRRHPASWSRLVRRQQWQLQHGSLSSLAASQAAVAVPWATTAFRHGGRAAKPSYQRVIQPCGKIRHPNAHAPRRASAARRLGHGASMEERDRASLRALVMCRMTVGTPQPRGQSRRWRMHPAQVKIPTLKRFTASCQADIPSQWCLGAAALQAQRKTPQ